MKTGSFIHGEWIQPESDRKVINRNPANPEEILSKFPAATAKDTEQAIAAAKGAFPAWSATPAPERGRVFARAVGLVTQRIDEIARVMTQEQGKIFKEAAGEVKKGINLLEYYAGAGFRIEGLTLPGETKDCFTCTVRKPLGVVGIITPWNFPWAIPVWKITPALVAGNTVVFKPAELTPGTAALMVEIFQEAGLPAGVLNMVVGPGSVVGEAILNHEEIKAISFTGSNQIGQRVINACAQGMKKVTCELGGKNAVIVRDDADLDAAATATAVGAFGSTGQRCTATSRVLVHEKIKPQFMRKLLEEANNFAPGDGLKPETTMGPSVDEKQFQTVLDYVEIGKTEARLILGGNRVGNNGFFMEPTIFDEVKPSDRIFQEEIFGPVLSVSSFKSFEEALDLANNSDFGLAS